MPINVFKLEDYLSKYEFTAPYLLCCSDAESFSMQEIIDMAAPAERRLWDTLHLGYTQVRGLPALREQLAHSLYPSLTQENISCFSGAEEGIFCALYALCDTSDHVIVLTPCYQSLVELPTLKGCNVTAIQLREENEWRIDVDDIKKAIQPNTKLVVMNFPHNPTGQVINQDELNALVKLLDAHGIWLFSDEVYRLLGKPSGSWAMPAAEIYPRALSLGVMSKAFGMAGLRVGWIACQDKELLKKIEYVRHYTSICNSAPSEIITLITLKNIESILARNNKITADNLQLLDRFFMEYADHFSWVRPQGGCIGFVRYEGKEIIDTFCDRLVKETGVLLLPASIYNHPTNHFRIGFGRRNMPEALDRFKRFLEAKPH